MKKLIVPMLVAAIAASTAFSAFAADAARPIPFRGKIAAVDKQAKTVKVGERTFHLTAESKLTKAGKPATLDDAKVGEEVGGQYKEVDKKLNVVSLRIGPRPDAPAAKPDDKK